MRLPRRPLREELYLPPESRARFLRVVVPMAPWVFGAPALAFVVGPALVADRTGAYRIAFAALAAVVTLSFGAGVQPLRAAAGATGRRAPGRRRTRAGRRRHPAAGARRAPALGGARPGRRGAARQSAYGICILTGLVETQALADPERVAGLTGIYYSLIYVGFLLPVVLSELARLADEDVLLVVVAAGCVACAVAVARGQSRNFVRT